VNIEDPSHVHHPISLISLMIISTICVVYGFRELSAAYHTVEFGAWSERALPGAGGVVTGALFALMSLQILT
jgi:hypothetical protein